MNRKRMFTRRAVLLRPLGLAASRNRGWRFALWAAAIMLTPALAMGAYQPGWLNPANNLSDVASTATARTNLGVPATTRAINTTAPVTGGGDLSADRTIAISDCTASVRGAVPTPPNNTTTFLRGDCTFAAPTLSPVTPTIYTGSSPVTLAATHNLLEVIEMATPATLTANLPSSGLVAGLVVCLKDGLKNFATNNATVKTTDGSTVDKVAGSTGYVMNQNGQGNCFQYAASGTNWYVM